MIKYIVTEDNLRLDNIVYNNYGNLEMMSEVLKVNAEIKVIVEIGDIINLPIATDALKDKALW